MESRVIYIQDHIDECTVIQKKCILELIEYDGSCKICEAGDGSRINISTAPEDLITQIYQYIHLFIEIPQSRLISF